MAGWQAGRLTVKPANCPRHRTDNVMQTQRIDFVGSQAVGKIVREWFRVVIVILESRSEIEGLDRHFWIGKKLVRNQRVRRGGIEGLERRVLKRGRK